MYHRIRKSVGIPTGRLFYFIYFFLFFTFSIYNFHYFFAGSMNRHSLLGKPATGDDVRPAQEVARILHGRSSVLEEDKVHKSDKMLDIST